MPVRPSGRDARSPLIVVWLCLASGNALLFFLLWLFNVWNERASATTAQAETAADRLLSFLVVSYPLWMVSLVGIMWCQFATRGIRSAIVLASALNMLFATVTMTLIGMALA